jgi:hypothetical protein
MKTGRDLRVLLALPVGMLVVAMLLPLVRLIRDWLGV